MIKSHSILAVIAARGGSKGLPRKNVRELAGCPLIAWSIEAAKRSKYIDKVIVSSESDEIISIAKRFGAEAPFVRPSELAADDTPGVDSVLHAISVLPGYDYVVLLQPTSPLRLTADIDSCIELAISKNAPSVVSITSPDKSPYWMFTRDVEEHLIPLVGTDLRRRQELPETFVLNGAIYVNRCQWLLEKKAFINEETLGYYMPKERSVDIDTHLDFLLCDLLMKENESTYAQSGTTIEPSSFQRI